MIKDSNKKSTKLDLRLSENEEEYESY